MVAIYQTIEETIKGGINGFEVIIMQFRELVVSSKEVNPKYFKKSHMPTFIFMSSNSCCTCGKFVYRWEDKSLVIVHCAFVWNSFPL